MTDAEARQLAAKLLARYQSHADFDDLVQETVLNAWRAREAHPDASMRTLVFTAAKLVPKMWFFSARCGDIVDKKAHIRLNVYQFSDILLENEEKWPKAEDPLEILLNQPPDEPEAEIRFAPHELRRLNEQSRQERLQNLLVRAKEAERALGTWLLADPDLSESYKQAIRLHYLKGTSMKEAAKAAGACSKDIYQAIRKARKRKERRERCQPPSAASP